MCNRLTLYRINTYSEDELLLSETEMIFNKDNDTIYIIVDDYGENLTEWTRKVSP